MRNQAYSQPTIDQAIAGEVVVNDKDRFVYATSLYPQMGGYVSCALVDFAKTASNCCFDMLIWHDGSFPIHEHLDGQCPAELHHCSALQFVRFGLDVIEKQIAVNGMDDGTLEELQEYVQKILALTSKES